MNSVQNPLALRWSRVARPGTAAAITLRRAFVGDKLIKVSGMSTSSRSTIPTAWSC